MVNDMKKIPVGYSHQEQYPVICLTLKSARQPDYEIAYASILDEIAKEYRRHSFVLKARNLTDAEKKRFQAIMDREAEKIEYAKALEFLSYCLSRYYGKNAIVLIDEYDVPLENAYFERFYEEMTAFIRSLFESVLKTNLHLEFPFFTGYLKKTEEHWEDGCVYVGLAIPNMEIRSIYRNTVLGWFEKKVRSLDMSELFRGIENGGIE